MEWQDLAQFVRQARSCSNYSIKMWRNLLLSVAGLKKNWRFCGLKTAIFTKNADLNLQNLKNLLILFCELSLWGLVIYIIHNVFVGLILSV
jgi:hypothetical protein